MYHQQEQHDHNTNNKENTRNSCCRCTRIILVRRQMKFVMHQYVFVYTSTPHRAGFWSIAASTTATLSNKTKRRTFARATCGHSAVPFVHRCRVCPNTSDSEEHMAIALSLIIEPPPFRRVLSDPAAYPAASPSYSYALSEPSFCVSKYLDRRIFPSGLVISTLCII